MQMQLIDLLTLMITKILTRSPIKAFTCGGPNPGRLVSPGVGLTATFTVGRFAFSSVRTTVPKWLLLLRQPGP
jgi:hypothetical protein